MIGSTKSRAQNLVHNIADKTNRYGIGAIALLGLAELAWFASVLFPVLFVFSTLIDFSRKWMTVLPGFMGVITFLFILAVGVFIAYQPSVYVARWRDRLKEKVARRHPLPPAMHTSADFQGSD
jgi:uncharacterized membrane protein (DUF485 family)